jgi:hypothetical protein
VVESPYIGLIQVPTYGTTVEWEGWSVIHQESVSVTPTVWTGWKNGRPDHLTGQVPRKPTEVSPPCGGGSAESICTRSLCLPPRGIGFREQSRKRTSVGDRVPPLPRDSQSLEETVARARAGRKFLIRGYNTSLKSTKVKEESVVEDEILPEELFEGVDKFSLSLTNKDFQIALDMSTETT